MPNDTQSGEDEEKCFLKRENATLKASVESLNSRCFELERRITKEISISNGLREQLETGKDSSSFKFKRQYDNGDLTGAIEDSINDIPAKKRRGRPPLHRNKQPVDLYQDINFCSEPTKDISSFSVAVRSPLPKKAGGRVMKVIDENNEELEASDDSQVPNDHQAFDPDESTDHVGQEIADHLLMDEELPALQTLQSQTNSLSTVGTAQSSALWSSSRQRPVAAADLSRACIPAMGISDKENIPLAQHPPISYLGRKTSSALAPKDMVIDDLKRTTSASSSSKKKKSGAAAGLEGKENSHDEGRQKSAVRTDTKVKSESKQVPVSLSEHIACVIDKLADEQIQTLSAKVLFRMLRDNEVTTTNLFDAQLHPALVRTVVRLSRRLQKGEIVNESLLHHSLVLLNNMIALSKPRHFAAIALKDLCPALVGLLHATERRTVRMAEQAAWTLDNIALARGQVREDVLEAGTMDVVLAVITENISEGVTLRATKLLVTLTEERELISDEQLGVLDALEALSQRDFQLVLVMEHACWVLVNVTHDNDALTSLIHGRPAILSRLAAIARDEGHVTAQTILHAVTVMGRLLSVGSETQVQRLLKVDFAATLRTLLDDQDADVSSCAFECVAALCLGGPVVLQRVIDADILKLLLNTINITSVRLLKDQACHALFNACLHADAKQVHVLVDDGVLLTICNVLNARGRENQSELVSDAMRSLRALLLCLLNSSVDEFKDVCAILGAAGGWDSVYRLRSSTRDEVHRLAVELEDIKKSVQI